MTQPKRAGDSPGTRNSSSGRLKISPLRQKYSVLPSGDTDGLYSDSAVFTASPRFPAPTERTKAPASDTVSFLNETSSTCSGTRPAVIVRSPRTSVNVAASVASSRTRRRLAEPGRFGVTRSMIKVPAPATIHAWISVVPVRHKGLVALNESSLTRIEPRHPRSADSSGHREKRREIVGESTFPARRRVHSAGHFRI